MQSPEVDKSGSDIAFARLTGDVVPPLRDLSDHGDRRALIKHRDDLVVVAGTGSEIAGRSDHGFMLGCSVVREFIIITKTIVGVSSEAAGACSDSGASEVSSS